MLALGQSALKDRQAQLGRKDLKAYRGKQGLQEQAELMVKSVHKGIQDLPGHKVSKD